MIVKSVPHKHRNFKRLINYIYDDQGRHDPRLDFDLCHNLRSYSKTEIITEFQENAKLKKRRANGTELYHDILSFGPKDQQYLTLDKIYDLSRKYVELRGDKGLCLAKPHLHQDHLHVHFCFSGNQYQSSKALRLTMMEFYQVRKELEEYQIQCFPELSNSLVYLRERRMVPSKNSKSQDLTSQERGKQVRQRANETQKSTSINNEQKISSRVDDIKNLRRERVNSMNRFR